MGLGSHFSSGFLDPRKASSQTFGSFSSRTLYLWAISCRLFMTVLRPDFTVENFSANSSSPYRALAQAASSAFRCFFMLTFKAVYEHSSLFPLPSFASCP